MLFLCALIVMSLLARAHPTQVVLEQQGIHPTDYEVVIGYFAQDDGTSIDPYDDSYFGLRSRDWRLFRQSVHDLNARARKGESFKAFFISRHGQGTHNVAEEKYGTPAWDCEWSMKYTDGNLTWGPDPDLTPLGIDQAERARDAWRREIDRGAPIPNRIYSSPLTRAAHTLDITWRDVKSAPRPLIREIFRESIGLHTCDRRSSRTAIAKRFPTFDIEDSLTEEDELWTADEQETGIQHVLRTRKALDEIFATDPSVFITIVGHGGTIESFLGAVGHPQLSVGTGGMVPVVVRARTREPIQTPDPGPSATAPACRPTVR